MAVYLRNSIKKTREFVAIYLASCCVISILMGKYFVCRQFVKAAYQSSDSKTSGTREIL